MSAQTSTGAHNQTRHRDGRLDLVRGLALVCLYVDHLPGNFFSRFSLHAYGFNDAAEVFVLVAGISAGLAYCTAFLNSRWLVPMKRVARRILQVYATHLMLIAVCAAAIWFAATASRNAEMLHTETFAFFGGSLADEIRHALSLRLQPHYLNMLPLYVLLLAAVPLIVLLLRIHVAVLIAVSFGLWLLPRTLQWNLPSDLHSPGWFFNPLAWQLLFVIGVLLGLADRQGYSLPRSRLLAFAAAGYCAFALVAVAPWAKLSVFAEWYVLPRDWLTVIDKQHLSLFRVIDVLALAYLAVYFVPASARWLDSFGARFFRSLGCASLSVFAVSAIVDALGWIIWHAGGQSVGCQFIVIVIGVVIMRATAYVVEARAKLVILLLRMILLTLQLHGAPKR
jgi:hypothetical protein